jgi:hypothetical protein
LRVHFKNMRETAMNIKGRSLSDAQGTHFVFFFKCAIDFACGERGGF